MTVRELIWNCRMTNVNFEFCICAKGYITDITEYFSYKEEKKVIELYGDMESLGWQFKERNLTIYIDKL